MIFGIVSLNSPQVFAQGETCDEPIPIQLDTLYQTESLNMDGFQSMYVSFTPTDTIGYFDVETEGDYPASLKLYEAGCFESPLLEANLFIDSNSVRSLSLYYYDFIPNEEYILEINQNSTEDVTNFQLGSYMPIFSSIIICDFPNSEIVRNGSFENTITNAQLGNLDRKIAQSKFWQSPSLNTSNRADYFHANSTDNDYQLPNNLFGNISMASSLYGSAAYAGLFTMLTSINNNSLYGGTGQFREWASVPLKNSLEEGVHYNVKMYVSISSNSLYNSGSIPPGIKLTVEGDPNHPNYLGKKTVDMTQVEIVALDADIQPTNVISSSTAGTWIEVSGVYTASGGENTLTVANFLTDNESVLASQQNQFNRTYFFIDAVSITPLSLCCTNPVYSVPDGYTTSDLLNEGALSSYVNGTTIEVPLLEIEGELIIDSDLTINNSKLKMSSGSEIKVSNNSTLTINESVLKSCEEMWEGIRVSNSNSEVIMDDSELWHAVKGINSINGGVYSITNSLFDNNLYGIYVDSYSGSHQGTVTGTVFQSSVCLKEPYDCDRAIAGIYVNEVADLSTGNEIQIGSYFTAANNTFNGPSIESNPIFVFVNEGLQYGIFINESSVKVYNNEFNQFENIPTITEDLVAIKIVGILHDASGVYFNGENAPTVRIGGGAFYQKNHFYKTSLAIEAENDINTYITKNIIDGSNLVESDHSDYLISVSNFGTDILDDPSVLEISQNDIQKVSRGIYLNLFRTVNTSIINNTIELLNNEGNIGIFTSDILTDVYSGSKTSMISNTISKATQGIWVNTGNVPIIKNNTISINSAFQPSTVPTVGIRLDELTYYDYAGYEPLVYNNDITSSGLTSNTMVKGMFFNMTSYELPIICNEIKKTGTAMNFGGVIAVLSSYQSPIYGNEFDYNYNSFVLTNNTELANIGNSTFPSDNEWLSNNTNYHTYTDGADGSETTLFTRGGGLPFQPTNNGSDGNPFISLNNSATGSNYDCSDDVIIDPDGPLGMQSQGGVPDFDAKYTSDTTKWLAQYQFYRSLPADTAIRNPQVQQYKDSVKLTAMGKLLQWQRADSLSLNQRNTAVKSLATNHPLEANLKSVLDYRLTAQSQQWDTLETSVLSDLEQMANACPFEAGPAVYHARGILMRYTGKLYHNACESYTTPAKPMLRMKSMTADESEKEDLLHVYPNPTKGQLNVILSLDKSDQGLLQIIDMQGRMVMEKPIIDGNNQIDLQQMGSSLYFYTIRKNGRIIKSDKLIIQ